MKKLLIIIVTIFIGAESLLAQENSQKTYLQVDFHKVKDENIGEYLSMEKEWKKVHGQLKKEGKISRWLLYEVLLPSGSTVEHNYITVSIYPNYADLETILPDLISAFSKALPDKNFYEYYGKTNQIRDRLRTEIFENTDGYWNPDAFFKHKFARIDYFKADIQNPAAYLDSEINFWKPAHKESVALGHKNGWQLCSKLYTSNSDKYSHFTVTFYTDFAQTNTQLSDFEASLKAAHPKLTEKQIIDKMLASFQSREFKDTQLIKLIDNQ